MDTYSSDALEAPIDPAELPADEEVFTGLRTLELGHLPLPRPQELVAAVAALAATDSATTEVAFVDLVKVVLGGGVLVGASDVHVDLLEPGLRLRYRIDGKFLEVPLLSCATGRKLIFAVCHHAGMDPCRADVPQDGGLQLRLNDRRVDLRIALIRTTAGLRMTLRYARAEDELTRLPELGFPAEVAARLESLLLQPSGVILFTGPCSSGKTTAMYAALRHIHDQSGGSRSIISVEDPVERSMDFFPQIGLKARSGLTYPRALRSVLRHDPNVIMLGEIRDRVTARLGLQLGLTGHLVLSTLHAGRAPLVFARLRRLGADPFLLATAMRAALALRLVRTVCVPCRDRWTLVRPGPGHPPAAGPIAFPELRGAPGCPTCLGTGYGHRRPIIEMLEVTDAVRDAVLSGDGQLGLEEAARATGFRSLEEQVREMVRAGETTPEEAARVLGTS